MPPTLTAAPAAPYNQPLTRFGQGWRMALCLFISVLAWAPTCLAQWHHHRWFWALGLVLGLASFVLVFWRRRYPLAVAILLNVLTLVSSPAAGPATLASVSLATRRVIWQIVVVGIVGIVAGQGNADIDPAGNHQSWLGSFFFNVVVNVALLLVGMYVGSRRELLWSLRERARQAEEQQELRMESARAGERERIAREMHDVLAHRISLVAMHAGALAYRTDLPPEQVSETASLIQAKAHEALTDLREVLGTLRADDLPRRPQPTVADLPALVEEATTSGMHVDFSSDIDPAVVPPELLGRTVYRIVQEGLTNARKHAPNTHVEVHLSGDPSSGLSVSVSNPVRVGVRTVTPGAGVGLVGLRERAVLVGGHIEVVEDTERFTLRGWVPWPT